jgi:hypothetical protein
MVSMIASTAAPAGSIHGSFLYLNTESRPSVHCPAWAQIDRLS